MPDAIQRVGMKLFLLPAGAYRELIIPNYLESMYLAKLPKSLHPPNNIMLGAENETTPDGRRARRGGPGINSRARIIRYPAAAPYARAFMPRRGQLFRNTRSRRGGREASTRSIVLTFFPPSAKKIRYSAIYIFHSFSRRETWFNSLVKICVCVCVCRAFPLRRSKSIRFSNSAR